jgi:hypothetical protein
MLFLEVAEGELDEESINYEELFEDEKFEDNKQTKSNQNMQAVKNENESQQTTSTTTNREQGNPDRLDKISNQEDIEIFNEWVNIPKEPEDLQRHSPLISM